MTAEREQGATSPPPQPPPRNDADQESLTDLIDRMDRAAFRRALEQRDLKFVSHTFRRR